MSFYGNLTDRSRTDLKFDRIYPNRFIMDQNVSTDSIYIGRYVLVNYEDGYDEILTQDDYNGYYCIESEKGKYSFWTDFSLGVNGEGIGYISKAENAKELQRLESDSTRSIAFKTDKKKHLFDFNLNNIYVKVKVNDDNTLEFMEETTEEEYNSFWEDSEVGWMERPVLIIEKDETGKRSISTIIPAKEEVSEEVEDNIDENFEDEVETEDEVEDIPIEEEPPIEPEPIDIFGRKEENEQNISIFVVYTYHQYTVAEAEKIWAWPYGGNDIDVKPIFCAGAVPTYENKDDKEEENYFHSKNGKINFRIDEAIYGITARGYHSTVWEKVYINDTYKYIKIAELNTYVPTISLKANAPTSSPKIPHFAPYGDNINYELDWQPSWGFRVKSADTAIKLRKFDEKGIKQNSYVQASENAITNDWTFNDGSFKSDASTRWETQIFDEEKRVYNKYQSEPISRTSKIREWRQINSDSSSAQAEIPAAIYFNKAGFDINKSVYSSGNDKKPINSKNYISVEPSGYSGRIYSDNVELESAIDTQELSIMLPALGDTVCEMWDLIYGNGQRNLDVSWQDAKYTNNIRKGLRMVGDSVNNKSGYERKDLETLAGCINTTHDLIGMIVAEEKQEDLSNFNPENIDEEYIEKINKYSEYFLYYNAADKQYYQKQPYTFLKEFASGEEFQPDLIFDEVVKTPEKEVIVFENQPGGNDEDHPNVGKEPGEKEPDEMPRYFFLEDSGVKLTDNENFNYNYIYSSVYQPDKTYVAIDSDAISKVDDLILYTAKNDYYVKQNNDYSKVGNGEKYNKDKTYLKIDWKPFGTFDISSEPEESFTSAELEVLNTKKLEQAIYIPGYYYYEIPVYEEVKLEDDSTTWVEREKSHYHIDYTASGFQYPKTKKAFADAYGYEEHQIPDSYLEKFVKPNHVRYYLPSFDKKDAIDKYTVEETYIPFTDDYTKSIYKELVSTRSFYQKVSGSDVYRRLTETECQTPGLKDVYLKEAQIIYQKVVEIDVDTVYFATLYDNNTFYYTVPGNDTFYNCITMDEAKAIFVNGEIRNQNKVHKKADIKVYTINAIEEVKNLWSTEEFPVRYEKLGMDKEYSGSFIVDTKGLSDGRDYYLIDPNKIRIVEMFEPNKYYKKEIVYDEATGAIIDEIFIEIKDFQEYQEAETLYTKNNDIRVIKDENGIFKAGDIWNSTVTPPANITLGYAVESYKMVQLEGFARSVNTIIGLILKLNALINEGNIYSRDRKTLQGSINSINDIINKFNHLFPNELVMTNSLGQIVAPRNSIKTDNYLTAGIANNQLALNHNEAQMPIIHDVNDDGEERVLSPEETAELINTPLDPEYLQPIVSIVQTENEDDENGTVVEKEVNYISFQVPIIYIDSKGHVYSQKSQEYRIECTALASKALNDLEHRVADIERNALRMYKEGVVYNETTESNDNINVSDEGGNE